MLSLSNDQLVVSVLDPVEDRARLGSRYCVGGYIYQVDDWRLGALTSGPGYPTEVFPPVFDGQGLPEAFRDPLWPGRESAADRDAMPAVGTRMLVIGVGTADLTENIRLMPVVELSKWDVDLEATRVVMRTSQSFEGWSLELTRDVTLVNRTIKSETRLANVGQKQIRTRWFPHPFVPPVRGDACKFNVPVTCPESSAYRLAENGFIQLRSDVVWNRAGHFQALGFTPGEKLVTLQRHPKIGLMVATCSYTPTFLPIWGNRFTFSFEPYHDVTVEPDAEASWSVTYDF